MNNFSAYMMRFMLWCSLAALAVACDANGPHTEKQRRLDGDASTLPAPELGGGSVLTVDRTLPTAVSEPPQTDTDVSSAAGSGAMPAIVDASGNPALDPETGMPLAPSSALDGLPPPQMPNDGADAQQAIGVLRDYYTAVNARDFARAYGLWANAGNASGQSPEQFANGYASTASVDAQLLAPGQVEGAAGSRYVQIPVRITATNSDGGRTRYGGSYTLRRLVVDGADAQQREWRIASAELRQIAP